MTGDRPGRRIVFTGGPGFGKSAVLEMLDASGYTCMPEAPRELILEQRELEDGILPQDDFIGFADLTAERMARHHREAPGGTVLFDRALPDMDAYLRYARQKISPRIRRLVESHPYDSPVFFFPDWEEIYALDGVRYETFDQARDIGRLIRESYVSRGYRVIEVPRTSVDHRVNFVRDHLEQL